MKKNLAIALALVLIGTGSYFLFKKDEAVNVPQPLKNLVGQADFVCDNNKTFIKASFYEGEKIEVEPGEPPVPTGSVSLILNDGRKFDLPQTISASGVRYATEDESFIFWNKGDDALVWERGPEKDFIGCSIIEGIKIISPAGGELWTKGQEVAISWFAEGSVEKINIRLEARENEDGQNFNAAIASGLPSSGEYKWVVDELYAEVMGIRGLPESDKYILIIEDADRNHIYDISDTFSIK